MKIDKKYSAYIVIGLLMAGMTACTGDKDFGQNGDEVQMINVIEIAPTNFDLPDGSICLEYGKSLQLPYTVKPDNATNPAITWSSNNEEVVSVNQEGVITAGTTTGSSIISVTPEIGFGTTTAVTSKVIKVIEKATLIESLSLKTDNEKDGETGTSVYAGEVRQMNVIALPETHTYSNYSWKSSNENVATVSDKGMVTTVNPGEATITATALDGSNASGTYNFKVLASITPTSVQFVNTEALQNLPYGTTVNLKDYVKLTPEDATFALIKWELSDTSMGSVSEAGVLNVNLSNNPEVLKLVGHSFTLTASTETGTQLGQVTLSTDGGHFIHNFKDGLAPFGMTLRQDAAYNIVGDHMHVKLGYQSATDSRQDMQIANTSGKGGFMLSTKKYKYFAIKLRRPYYYDATNGTYSKYGPLGDWRANKLAINLTPTTASNLGHWTSFKQLDLTNDKLIDEVWDGQAKIYVWTLDSDSRLTEGTDAETGLIDIKWADLIIADVKADIEQSYDIYWIGTFDSLEAIKKYELENQ